MPSALYNLVGLVIQRAPFLVVIPMPHPYTEVVGLFFREDISQGIQSHAIDDVLTFLADIVHSAQLPMHFTSQYPWNPSFPLLLCI